MDRDEPDAAGDEQTLTRATLLARFSTAAGGALALGALGTGEALAGRSRRRGHSIHMRHASAYSAEVPASWFDLSLVLVRTTPGFSPPVASRALAYAGVTLYKSLAQNGSRLCHGPTVANSALASILRALFPTTPPTSIAAIDELEHRFAAQAHAVLPRRTYARSVARGEAVARRVFEWSKTDGGHEGFLRNFPPYAPPVGPGLWEPTPPAFSAALQPTWGENRPFARRSRRCSAGPPPAYSEEPGSPFYDEANECYLAVVNLTPEQEAIARFWSDDPGQTSTPPGHSISILTQVVRQLDLPLDTAAEAYARVGMAVNDAFISCWGTKYSYNLLRPVTYVRGLIDPDWLPLLTTPPFPEYTSGHSVQSRAAAQVLTDMFGDVAFTDHTHDARGLPARSFGSFVEAAEEAALSRLLGGIHFRAAIDRGLEQGICVGQRVSALFEHQRRHEHERRRRGRRAPALKSRLR